MHQNKIPPLAGICTYEEACRTGYAVDDNVELLKRYNYIKVRLMEIASQHLNHAPEWEVKCALSLHIWLDTEHSKMLRKRVSEMREPPLHMDKVPDDRLLRLMDELLYADDTLELIVGIYAVIRTELIHALSRHLSNTNPLADHPTCRILEMIIMEEQKMLSWGEAAIAALITDEETKIKAELWKSHLNVILLAAGGFHNYEAAGPFDNALPELRSQKKLEISYIPRRDSRFTDLYNYDDTPDKVSYDEQRSPEERTWALLYKRLREMDVPEMMCSIVAQTKEKPWDYYVDMCRQIWDEARHSMMGEVGFTAKGIDWTKLPIRITFSHELNTIVTPEERHAILYAIEFSLMPGDTGKKFEWETVKKSGYGLAVTFQDHDWADEVLHTQIGRKWLVSELGGHQAVMDLAQQAYRKINDHRPTYDCEHKNWWDSFYDTIKHVSLT